jgi:ribosomal protein L24E
MYYDCCRFCGKDISPGIFYKRSKRVDAHFCSEKCKVDFHNTKRKLARKEAALKRLEIEIFELKRKLAWDHGD